MPPFQTLASIATALGHALLDGVWLGVVLAATLGVGLRVCRGVNAASRHALWYAALIAIAAVPVAGFTWSIAHAAASTAPLAAAPTLSLTSANYTSALPERPTHPRAATTISNDLSTVPAGRQSSLKPARWSAAPGTPAAPAISSVEAAELIFGIVMVIAALSAAGLIGVSISLARLLAVKRDSRPFDARDEARLRRWSARPSIGRPVGLRVSQGVDVPAAVGFFHPTILVPASWPANLDADELDKIVMHEYSHLRRLDDWTAFAQRVAERVFWFNPALRYIASRANLEREIACDDWVISESSSAASYAECLWRIAQFAHMPAAKMPVPAALVTRAQIVERIEHLMNADRNVAPRMRPAVLLAIAPVAAALLIVGVVRAPAITLASPPIAATVGTRAAHPASAWKAPVALPLALTHANVIHANVPHGRSITTAPLKTVALSGNGLDVRSLLQSCSGCDLSGKDLRNADLHGLRLSGDDMSNIDLRGADLRGVHFDGVDLTGARLDNADLTGAVFSGSDIQRISWAGAKMDGLRLEGVTIDAAMLRSGSIRWLLGACSGCDMAGLDMRGLDLNGVHLEGANLSRADLRGTNLKNAVLDGVDLSGAQLNGTDLTNAQLNGCDLTHVDLRHAHIQGLKLEGADLRHLQFSGLDVRGLTADGADLSGAQLRNVDLSGVRMNGSDFRSADLTGAQLADGEFVGADFRNAHLDGANLQRSRLCGYNTFTDDHGVVLKHEKSCANLSGASTAGTDLRGVQLCDWHGGNASCRAVSSAELKTYTHSQLTGAVLPSF